MNYTFISTYSTLGVVVDPGSSSIIAGTTQVQQFPARIVKFKHHVYKTNDESTALLLAKRLINDRRMGFHSSFLPHPECLDAVRDLVKKHNIEEDVEAIAAGVVKKTPEETKMLAEQSTQKLTETVEALKAQMEALQAENEALKTKPKRSRATKPEIIPNEADDTAASDDAETTDSNE